MLPCVLAFHVCLQEIVIAVSYAGSIVGRCYWGSNLIREGTNNTSTLMYMGGMPTKGQVCFVVFASCCVDVLCRAVDEAALPF